MSEFALQDGTPCTLERLCHAEPEWAVSRLRYERKELAALEAQLSTEREEREHLDAEAERLRSRGNNYRDEMFTLRNRAETAERRVSEWKHRIREATEHHCSCGGDGPGQGCNACEIYHHVFATPEPPE